MKKLGKQKNACAPLRTTDYGLRTNSGQSLIEVLIGIAIGTIFITGIVAILVLTLRIGFQNKFTQSAAELAGGLTDQVAVFSDANWHNVYDAESHDGLTAYHLTQSDQFFVLANGSEAVSSEAGTFARWFTVSDVYRDSTGALVTTGGTLDPSTIKITAYASWTQGGSPAQVTFEKYLTRSKSRIFHQTDWSGGNNQEGPIATVNTRFTTSSNVTHSAAGSLTITDLSVEASTSTTSNIDATDQCAWNDVIGWVDFRSTNNVFVSSTIITGYASSGVGYIALDCATSPSPNCSFLYRVSNDGTGTLAGWAWNDAIGWISFASSSAQSTHGGTIDENGNFFGWAWNDVVGWFSFNCADTGVCGTSSYKTKTRWSITVISASLISSVFDTQVTGGGAFNSILWQGVKPTGTNVKFQIASSDNASGPWTYVGIDGTNSTYYQPAGPNTQLSISRTAHNNDRYVRYKVFLESDLDKTLTPRVDDIIISWSP